MKWFRIYLDHFLTLRISRENHSTDASISLYRLKSNKGFGVYISRENHSTDALWGLKR